MSSAELIRFNTVNPPGNERECQEWLRGYLTDAGFECELAGAEPERPNLVARLRGERRRPGARLPLARRHRARRRRRTGRATRGRARSTTASLWGRGALDMKSQTAAEAVAAARARARGLAPAARRAEGHLASPTRRPAAASAPSG